MTKFDGEAFGREMLEAVKGYVQPLRDELAATKAANVALLARLEALEGRSAVPGPEGPAGPAGLDGAPGLDGRDGAPGAAGADGRDGVDGQPGAPGAQGPQGERGPKGETGPAGPVGMVGDAGERGPQGEKGLDGKDGRDGQPGVPGRDGKDGLGFDDMTIEHDGARGFTFKLIRGERTKEFAFRVPVVIDQGVWRDGNGYENGDGVTWRGSYWIAQKATTSKPDDGNADWRLAVKKGRDGKDAVRMVGAS